MVADGGQPSHPFSLGSDVYSLGQYEDILWFWRADAGGFREREFQHQLIAWKDFRQSQERARDFFIPRKRFHEYENAIRESREDARWKWDIRVDEDRHKQNRLEDWNEFRALYYRRRKAHRRKILPLEKEFFDYWKKLEDIEPGLGGSLPSADEGLGYVMDAEKRRENAKSRIDTADRKLQQARSKKHTDKSVLIETAQKELELAEEISRLEGCASCARRTFGREQIHLKKWEVFVRWIDDQYSAIAAECGCTTDDSAHGVVPTSLSRPKRVNGYHDQKPPSKSRKSTHTKSALRPDPSKISKPAKNKTHRQRKAQVLFSDAAQSMTAMMPHSVETNFAVPWSGRLRQSRLDRPCRNPQRAHLGPVGASKVTKTKTTLHRTKRGISLRKQARNERCTASLGPNKRHFGDVSSLRRSQRIKAQREKFISEESK